MPNPFMFNIPGQVDRGQFAAAAIQKKQKESQGELSYYQRLQAAVSQEQDRGYPWPDDSRTRQDLNSFYSWTTTPGLIGKAVSNFMPDVPDMPSMPSIPERGDKGTPNTHLRGLPASSAISPFIDSAARFGRNEIAPPASRAWDVVSRTVTSGLHGLIPKEFGVPDPNRNRKKDATAPKLLDLKGPSAKASETADSVKKAAETLRAGAVPTPELVADVHLKAQEVTSEGGKPQSNEEQAEKRRGIIDQLKKIGKSERIDLLSAGLSILANTGTPGKPAASVIGQGLLAGVAQAAYDRQQRIENALDERIVAAREMSARASLMAGQGAFIRGLKSGSGSGIDISNEAIDKAAKSIAGQVAGGDEELTDKLTPFFSISYQRAIDAAGGDPARVDMESVASTGMALAQDSGVSIEEDRKWFGFAGGDNLRERDFDPREQAGSSSVANALLKFFQTQ